MQPISRTDARNVRHHSSTPMWWPARRQPLRRCHVNPPPHNPRHDAISMRGGNLKHFSKGGELRRARLLRISAPSTGHRPRDTRLGSSHVQPGQTNTAASHAKLDRTTPTRHTSWLATRAARPKPLDGRHARHALTPRAQRKRSST